jgi:IS30 family transposase
MAIHLTLEERDRIAQLRHQGVQQEDIAAAIGRSPSTVSRELRRNQTHGEYHAAQAQRHAERRRRERPLVRKMDDPKLHPLVRRGLATLVDRKSRLTIIVKIQSKDADHVHEKLKQCVKELDDEHRRSITFDNGTEFNRCHRLEKHLGMALYFADPGCPFQRGTNENTNGLIRQYFPKGTDFRNISHHQVRQVENSLHNRPAHA